MPENEEHENMENRRIGVDAVLIRMFLEMTPEQRLAANDNTLRAIQELKNGFKKTKPASTGSERPY
jgi:hypothetical protein